MDPNLQIKSSSGCKELLLRQLSYAVTSSVLSQVVILFLFLFSITFNILHPVEWLYLTFRTVISLSTWLFMIPFLSIIFAQSIICAKDYVFQAKYCSTRIQKFFAIFSVHNSMLLVLHVLIGGLTVWLFLSMSGKSYGNLYEPCKNDRSCLVEETFFLILCGIWIGLYFFLRIYSSEKKMLFPVVQQRKLPQFKSRLIPLLRESYAAAVLPTLYYILFYFIFGEQIRNNFIVLFHLRDQDGSSVGIFIYLYAWLFAALYIFNMNLMRYFFELFLTEYMQFPIETATKNELTLTEALNINTVPIVQHLAALDLFLLSYNSKARREMLFKLSQPGNHPHIWNNLIQNSLKIITEHTEMLNKSANAIINPEQVKKVELQSPLLETPVKKNHTFRNMRNISLQDMSMPLDVITVSHNKDLTFTVTSESLKGKVETKLNTFTSTLRAKLGINYFFGELPVVSIQCCLGNGQVIMWLTQGLSSLAVASLKEDKFGIVQKDIPVIISALVELKQSIDKLNRIPALLRKGNGLDDFNTKMKAGISSAIRRSLYNICNNFGPYLKYLPLNKDIVQFLHIYNSHKAV